MNKNIVSPSSSASSQLEFYERQQKPLLDIQEFNHLAREAINAHATMMFYVLYLGAKQIARPPFEADGYWLNVHGLNLHLVQSRRVTQRQEILAQRITYFKSAFEQQQEPSVDHFAFICKYDTVGLRECEETLTANGIRFYRFGGPDSLTGITQIFLWDPDGNIVEISNCAPPCGLIRCMKNAEPSLNLDVTEQIKLYETNENKNTSENEEEDGWQPSTPAPASPKKFSASLSGIINSKIGKTT
ncbi:hypothetical protein ScalyP_jg259 [Parmales sp. scaly parma]|nr:hypothetical protein ScalyP_jg259 [Parmales sp. scaly parma]